MLFSKKKSDVGVTPWRHKKLRPMDERVPHPWIKQNSFGSRWEAWEKEPVIRIMPSSPSGSFSKSPFDPAFPRSSSRSFRSLPTPMRSFSKMTSMLPSPSIQTAKKKGVLRLFAKPKKFGPLPPILAQTRNMPAIRKGKILQMSDLFTKAPTKEEIRRIITKWTGSAYHYIAKARRIKTHLLDKEWLQVDWAMATYMRDYSLRAPMMPVKARDPLDKSRSSQKATFKGVTLEPKYQDVPRYLYRGVNWSVGTGKVLSDSSYTSWSLNPHMAASFGQTKSRFGYDGGRGVKIHATRVLRLDISTIPRGTPWIWFSGTGARLQNGWNISTMSDTENEVVLPPGSLSLVDTSRIAMAGRRATASLGNTRATVIDVRFTPDRNATAIWVQPGGRPTRIFK